MDDEIVMMWEMSKMKGTYLHCKTGPALISPTGHKAWYLNGIEYTFDKWCDELGLTKSERVEMKLKHA